MKELQGKVVHKKKKYIYKPKFDGVLPHNYDPREYQLPLLDAIDSGVKRAAVVWHRRAGKDKTCINVCSKKMYERVGEYYYVFPTYNQGRKVLWDGIDREGKKFLDHFPSRQLDGKPNDTQMKLKYKNGSLFQIVGSDNINSIVGTNPVGLILSEYSLQNPAVWDYLRPILAENEGWAIFIFTPRGENHAFDIYTLAKNDSNWFCQLLTVDDTGAIPKEVLEQERREIIAKDGNDALYQQEYMCSFSVPIPGAYYADQIIEAYSEGRVGNVPYDPSFPVDTWWDLGMRDEMALWFTQSIGSEIRAIDYYENTGKGFDFYAKVLQDKKYKYKEHVGPHDLRVRELGTGRERFITASNLGISFRVLPNTDRQDGIDAVRLIFPKCWFDARKCHQGLNALKSYHREYNEERKCYMNNPYHDWSSNGADAFRTMAMGIDVQRSRPKPDAYSIKPQRSTYHWTSETC